MIALQLLMRLHPHKIGTNNLVTDQPVSSRPFPACGDQLLQLQSAICLSLFLAHAVAKAAKRK